MEKDMNYMNFSDVSRFLFLPNDCGSYLSYNKRLCKKYLVARLYYLLCLITCAF